MYCPQCSQEQVNAENRFCSRCGFPLADVVEALANDGYVNRNTKQEIKGLRLRISIGLALMAFSLVFFIVSLVLGTPEPNYVIQLNLLVTLILFLIGLGWIGYSLWRGFDVDAKRVQKSSPGHRKLNDALTAQLETANPPALPEAYAAPATVDKDRGSLTSITEDTTRFLKRDR